MPFFFDKAGQLFGRFKWKSSPYIAIPICTHQTYSAFMSIYRNQ